MATDIASNSTIYQTRLPAVENAPADAVPKTPQVSSADSDEVSSALQGAITRGTESLRQMSDEIRTTKEKNEIAAKQDAIEGKKLTGAQQEHELEAVLPQGENSGVSPDGVTPADGPQQSATDATPPMDTNAGVDASTTDTANGTPAATTPKADTPTEGDSMAPAPMTEEDAVMTLQSNMEIVPNDLHISDLDKLSKDESLPPKLRDAYAYLRDHTDFTSKVDNINLTSRRDRRRNENDHVIGKVDWDKISQDSKYVAPNQSLSKAYSQYYVPSDADPKGKDTTPRPITMTDACRELYLYSDSLPDKINQDELQKIVDGRCQGKCPAQLRAAAQFMLDNPDKRELIAPGGSISRGGIQDTALAQVNLHPDELSAINTVKAKSDVFLRDGNITRESLASLTADKTTSADVRKAAQKLLDDPLAFGLLDNADLGASKDDHAVNDGQISAGDISAIDRRLSAANLKAPPAAGKSDLTKAKPGEKPGAMGAEVQKAALTSTSLLLAKNVAEKDAAASKALKAKALAAMDEGWANDPAVKIVRPKKVKGIKRILKKALPIIGKILTAVKTVVDVVASVLPPGISQVVLAVGVGIATVKNFSVGVGESLLNGGKSIKGAFKAAAKVEAMDLAESAMSAIPGGGIAVAGQIAGKVAVRAGTAIVGEAAMVGAQKAAVAVTERATLAGAKASATASRSVARFTASRGTLEAAETSGEKLAVKGSERQAAHGAETSVSRSGTSSTGTAQSSKTATKEQGAKQGAQTEAEETTAGAAKEGTKDVAKDEAKLQAQQHMPQDGSQVGGDQASSEQLAYEDDVMNQAFASWIQGAGSKTSQIKTDSTSWMVDENKDDADKDDDEKSASNDEPLLKKGNGNG